MARDKPSSSKPDTSELEGVRAEVVRLQDELDGLRREHALELSTRGHAMSEMTSVRDSWREAAGLATTARDELHFVVATLEEKLVAADKEITRCHAALSKPSIAPALVANRPDSWSRDR